MPIKALSGCETGFFILQNRLYRNGREIFRSCDCIFIPVLYDFRASPFSISRIFFVKKKSRPKAYIYSLLSLQSDENRSRCAFIFAVGLHHIHAMCQLVHAFAEACCTARHGGRCGRSSVG